MSEMNGDCEAGDTERQEAELRERLLELETFIAKSSKASKKGWTIGVRCITHAHLLEARMVFGHGGIL